MIVLSIEMDLANNANLTNLQIATREDVFNQTVRAIKGSTSRVNAKAVLLSREQLKIREVVSTLHVTITSWLSLAKECV